MGERRTVARLVEEITSTWPLGVSGAQGFDSCGATVQSLTCSELPAGRLKQRRPSAPRRTPTPYLLSLYNLSDLLDKQGRSDAAIACLRRALRAVPAYADTMFNLALLLQRNNEHAEAAEYWRRLGSAGASVPKVLQDASALVGIVISIMQLILDGVIFRLGSGAIHS